MHPVSSLCVTCDTSHNLCGPCAMDVLGSHSRVALSCRCTPLTQRQHIHHQAHGAASNCSGCGARAGPRCTLASAVQAPPHAETLSLTVPPPSAWEQAPLQSPRDWLTAMAPEIVSHVDEAPVFHLIFDKDKTTTTTRQRVDEADVSNPDSWPEIRRSMMAADPDAVVFVHELENDSRSTDGDDGEVRARPEEAKLAPATSRLSLSRSFNARNKTWGVVVLGRSSSHACYILQTSKVFSPAGATTHFSLTKAKCFAPSLHQQMQQAWLV